MSTRYRIIIDNIEPADLRFTDLAILYGLRTMPGKDAIVCYNSDQQGWGDRKFYIRKNKASLLVKRFDNNVKNEPNQTIGEALEILHNKGE